MGLKLCEGGTLGSHNAVIWGARHLRFVAHHFPAWRHLEWPRLLMGAPCANFNLELV